MGLDKAIKSVQAQTCKDFEQIFLVDHERRGMRYANEQFERHKTIPRGEYIYHLDDDGTLADKYFVEKVRQCAIKANWPDVVLVHSYDLVDKAHRPRGAIWALNWENGERPTRWSGSGYCFVVKAEVWRANVWRYYYGQGKEWHTGGDWMFMTGLISFGRALRIVRLEVTGGQGQRGYGRSETADRNWFDKVAKRWGLEALDNDVWRLRHDGG